MVDLFRGHYNIPLVAVDARARFLDALQGVTDPEVKRKMIGKLFVDVFEAEAEKLGEVDFLAQGTLYPDVIESVSATGGPSATIKSHHNVGGLPEHMRLKLIEPLRELFKDEVRALGRELGLPSAFVDRHPFPGPGLAIRIPGEVTEEKLAILRKADAIYLDEIRKRGLYDKIWQAFAVLLPVRTVGVMGDARTYDYALRAPRRDLDRRHDRRLLRLLPRFSGRGGAAHHQRGARHQPRGLRHHLQAARAPSSGSRGEPRLHHLARLASTCRTSRWGPPPNHNAMLTARERSKSAAKRSRIMSANLPRRGCRGLAPQPLAKPRSCDEVPGAKRSGFLLLRCEISPLTRRPIRNPNCAVCVTQGGVTCQVIPTNAA